MKRSNAGQARVVVSRAFDQAFRAAGHPEAKLKKIGAELEQLRKDIRPHPCAAPATSRCGAGWSMSCTSVSDRDAGDWAYMERELPFHPQDKQGAREAARRGRECSSWRSSRP